MRYVKVLLLLMVVCTSLVSCGPKNNVAIIASTGEVISVSAGEEYRLEQSESDTFYIYQGAYVKGYGFYCDSEVYDTYAELSEIGMYLIADSGEVNGVPYSIYIVDNSLYCIVRISDKTSCMLEIDVYNQYTINSILKSLHFEVK